MTSGNNFYNNKTKTLKDDACAVHSIESVYFYMAHTAEDKLADVPKHHSESTSLSISPKRKAMKYLC